MSKKSKFPGQGRIGDTASGGSKVNGGTAPYAPPSARVPKGETLSRSTRDQWAPGDTQGTGAISSHNDIGLFLRGAKSRGPYGGPSFRSFNNTEKDYMSGNTSSISTFPVPSAASPSSRASGSRGFSRKMPLSRGKGTGSGSAGYGRRG